MSACCDYCAERNDVNTILVSYRVLMRRRFPFVAAKTDDCPGDAANHPRRLLPPNPTPPVRPDGRLGPRQGAGDRCGRHAGTRLAPAARRFVRCPTVRRLFGLRPRGAGSARRPPEARPPKSIGRERMCWCSSDAECYQRTNLRKPLAAVRRHQPCAMRPGSGFLPGWRRVPSDARAAPGHRRKRNGHRRGASGLGLAVTDGVVYAYRNRATPVDPGNTSPTGALPPTARNSRTRWRQSPPDRVVIRDDCRPDRRSTRIRRAVSLDAIGRAVRTSAGTPGLASDRGLTVNENIILIKEWYTVRNCWTALAACNNNSGLLAGVVAMPRRRFEWKLMSSGRYPRVVSHRVV